MLGQAFDGQLVDKVQFYLAPLLTGGAALAVGGKGAGATAEAAKLSQLRFEKIGRDLAVTGYPRWSEEASE